MKYRRADMLLPVASEAVLPAILFASGPSCGPLASLGLDRDVVKENIPADAIGDDAAELGGIEVGGAFGVPTVREPDGLARSSRNRYLDSKDRTRARLLLLRILTATVRRFRAGDHVGAALDDATDALREQGFGVDYLELVDGPRTMGAVSCAVASCGAGGRETRTHSSCALRPRGTSHLQHDQEDDS
jgi:Pantoate-beta-alanine ligase